MGFVGGIVSGISNAVKNVSSVVSNVAKAVTSVATPILNQAKDIFSAVSKGAGFVGQIANMKLPFGLPNPLQALGPLAQGIQFGAGGIGDVLKQLGGMLGQAQIGGQTITTPSLGDRAATVAHQASAITAGVAAAASGPAAAASSSAGAVAQQGTGGGMYSTGWSKQQNEAYAAAKADGASDSELRRMKAMNDMQNHQELMQFISQMQSMMHETAKSIIQNIR